MKVRVKLDGTAKTVDVGELDLCTLLQLQERTANVFQLGETPFTLSLNKRDGLSGEDQTLSQLGIVPGDLIFVLCPDFSLGHDHNSSANGTNNIAASTSTSSSSCGNDAAVTGSVTSCGGHVACQEAGTVHGEDLDQQIAETASRTETGSEGNDDAGSEEVLPTDEDSSAGATTSSEDRQQLSPCPLEDPEVNRCLQEPLLCRESTPSSVPVLLRDVFTSAGCTGLTEALWVAVHTLMLEVGFRPQQDGDLSLDAGWNGHGFYKQEYRHLCVAAQHKCSLIGVPMGPLLIVHGVTSGDPPLKTDPQQLKVSDYMQGTTVDQDVCNVYKNLERLSRTVKDLICQRLMSQLSEVCGFPVSPGLLSLSYELKLKVLSYLPAGSLTKVGQVCRDLNVTYRDPFLWRRLYLREFGQNGDNSLNKNWYQLYKEAYHHRRERRRLSRHRHQVFTGMPPWLNPPAGYFAGLVPRPYPSGIIGGDYDINPEFASSISHPFLGQPQAPNPFLPQGPRIPGGPFLPRPRFDDPFGPDTGPGPRFVALGGASSRSSRASPFTSLGGHRYL